MKKPKKSSPPLRHTEQRNSRAHSLDRMPASAIVRAIAREDATVARVVAREMPRIARAVELIARSLDKGGRLLYVGAGTSGRLAAADAAECPPTFGTSPRLVQAVIAGGSRALTTPVEGAEDDSAAGVQDIAARRLTKNDVVVGLSASGATPYVLGALECARRRRARTIAITNNPRTPLTRAAHIAIVAETGPEVVAGSTRMKAGTAQKMILNMLSTAAMARLGHVFNNWMIDVQLSSRKLRERGLRILQEATGAGEREAEQALRMAKNDLRVALIVLKRGVRTAEARRRLRNAGGKLRRALGE